MDNLKEQIAKWLFNFVQDRERLTLDWEEQETYYLTETEELLKTLPNLVQLQAGEDGLVKKESRCVKCRAENNGECFDIECTTHSYERGFKDGTVAQKALDDKEKEEAVKKVFKELRGKMWHSETPYCEREYRITVEDYEAILKKTLEELK